MAKKTSPLLPATGRRLNELGERIRLARLRRKLTAASVAERSGMAPMTLRAVERGEPGVTMGAYAAVLQVLGLEDDIDLLAADDALGRQLQDSRMRPPATAREPEPLPYSARTPAQAATRKPAGAAQHSRLSGPVVSASELARLIPPQRTKKGKR